MNKEKFIKKLEDVFNEGFTPSNGGVYRRFYIKDFFGFITLLGNEPKVEVFWGSEEKQKAYLDYFLAIAFLDKNNMLRLFNDFVLKHSIYQKNHEESLIKYGNDQLKKDLRNTLPEAKTFEQDIRIKEYRDKEDCIIDAYIMWLKMPNGVEPYFEFNVCNNADNIMKSLRSELKQNKDVQYLVTCFVDAYNLSI